MRTPAQFLERARALLGQAKDEVDRAIAVDTLYYAVHYHVCEALGVQIDSKNKNHERVNDAIFDKIDSKTSQRYRSLKKLRVRAKYILRETLTQEDMHQARSHAEAVLEALRRHGERAANASNTARIISLHKSG